MVLRMASLMPLLSDILPMILPSKTEIIRDPVKGDAREGRAHRGGGGAKGDEGRGGGGGGGGGSIEQPAVVGRCDKMCASVLMTRPHSSSPVRHNGEQDAIIYAVSGSCTLIVQEGFRGDLTIHRLGPGDFAFVPAWTEHQARNDSDDEAVWLVTQSGSRPVGAILTDWGGDVIRSIS